MDKLKAAICLWDNGLLEIDQVFKIATLVSEPIDSYQAAKYQNKVGIIAAVFKNANYAAEMAAINGLRKLTK
jgi:hypothetical protein